MWLSCYKAVSHKAKTVIIPWQHAATGKKVCDNNHTHTHTPVSSFNNFLQLVCQQSSLISNILSWWPTLWCNSLGLMPFLLHIEMGHNRRGLSKNDRFCHRMCSIFLHLYWCCLPLIFVKPCFNFVWIVRWVYFSQKCNSMPLLVFMWFQFRMPVKKVHFRRSYLQDKPCGFYETRLP